MGDDQLQVQLEEENPDREVLDRQKKSCRSKLRRRFLIEVFSITKGLRRMCQWFAGEHLTGQPT